MGTLFVPSQMANSVYPLLEAPRLGPLGSLQAGRGLGDARGGLRRKLVVLAGGERDEAGFRSAQDCPQIVLGPKLRLEGEIVLAGTTLELVLARASVPVALAALLFFI